MGKIVENVFQVEVRYASGGYSQADYLIINTEDNRIPSQIPLNHEGFPTLRYDWKEGQTVSFITTTGQEKIYFAHNLLSITFSRTYENND